MKKFGLILGTVVLVLAWTLSVAGQERVEHPAKQLQEVLGLTDTQLAAIRAEQQAAGARMHELRVEMQKLDEQIYHTAEETGDPTTIGKLVLQKIGFQKQIEGEEAGLRANVNTILTPAQQDKLKQLMEADQVFRGWEALLMGGERRVRHESARRGGAMRRQPRPQKLPEK